MFPDLEPSPPSDVTERLITQMQSMDEMLRRIHELLADLTSYSSQKQTIEKRIDELENRVNRLHGLVMDLTHAGVRPAESGDRLATLEAVVTKLGTLTAEQKAYLESQVTQQNQNLEDLKRHFTSHKSEDESVLHEIDDLMRRKRSR